MGLRSGCIKEHSGEMRNYGGSKRQRRAVKQSKKGRQRQGNGNGCRYKGRPAERCLRMNKGRRKEMANSKGGEEARLPPGENRIQGRTVEENMKRFVTSAYKDEGPSTMTGTK